jgi:cardiolipin synthase
VTEPLFTLANQLTLLRMLLIPVFVILMLYGYRAWALAVFVLAGVTDLLDGLAARRAGQQTTLGVWLDPAADKLLIVATVVVLTLPNIGLIHPLPLWLTILAISRDVGIVATVAIVNLAMGPRTFKPSLLGKAATAGYIVACAVVLLVNVVQDLEILADLAIWTAAGLTIASGVHYVWTFARVINRAEPID